MTDVRRAVAVSDLSSKSNSNNNHSSKSSSRPAAMTRRSTNQKLGKSPRDREREWEEERWWEEERETFPQFW
jgi:hypothetical protein